MRIRLSVEIEDQLLRDLRRYFKIGLETVRHDLNDALTQTVEIYRRDVERKKGSTPQTVPGKENLAPACGCASSQRRSSAPKKG